jgi:hypothetical protein
MPKTTQSQPPAEFAAAPADEPDTNATVSHTTAPAGSGTRWRRVVVMALAVLGIGAVAAGGLSFLGDSDEAAGEVLLEPEGSTGPDPFGRIPVLQVSTTTTSTTTTTTTTTSTTTESVTTSTTSSTGSTVSVRTLTGDTPGLYGGTRDAGRCAPALMTQFLLENPSKAAAWLEGLNRDPNLFWPSGAPVEAEELADYIATLTPVTLRADTRVTNHGYRDGKPTPRQSVLQAGTSVLVDPQGIPRAKCACGNPLAPPEPVAGTPSYTGEKWDGFDPADMVAAAPGAVVERFELIDVTTDQPFSRPVGSDGVIDGEPGATGPTSIPTTVPPATTLPTTTQATTSTTSDATVLQGDTFCEAYVEWSDRALTVDVEDPEAIRVFFAGAFDDLEALAPPEIEYELALVSDTFATIGVDDFLFGNYSDDVVVAIETIDLYAVDACGIG